MKTEAQEPVMLLPGSLNNGIYVKSKVFTSQRGKE